MTALKSYLDRVWKYRYLSMHLVGSDLRSRFRRSHLGIIWAVLQPMLLALLFSFVLVQLFNQPFRDQALYVFAGVVVWEMFSAAVMAGSTALINVEGFLRQSPIPILVFHIRTAFNNAVIALLGLFGFVLFCLIIAPDIFTVYWLFLPVWFLIALLFTLPIIVISSVVNILFRDYQQAIGVLMQALWYVSPAFIPRHVFESPAIVGWTNINPVASLLDLFRDPMIYQKVPQIHDLANISVWTIGASIIAALLLMRYERKIIFLF